MFANILDNMKVSMAGISKDFSNMFFGSANVVANVVNLRMKV